MTRGYIQVSSTGGTASTAFMKHFEKYIPMNTHSFAPGTDVGLLKHQRVPGTNPAYWCPPHEHGAFHKDRSTFRVFNEIAGSIFFYSDPRVITTSLFKRALVKVHLENMGIPERWNLFPEVQGENGEHVPCAIRADMTAYAYRGDDIFLLEKMIENWFLTPTNFPRLLIKSETMFQNSESIMKFMGVPDEVAFFEEKKRKTSVSNLEHYDGLTQMFDKFIKVYEKLPSIVEITPETQREITEMYKGLRKNAQ